MSAARARGGQLVVENVALLSGGARTFEERYKVAISDDSFRKAGNTQAAFPLLHFLLCSIDPEVAPNAFKPCFPVMDREQERDFRRVVDARLTILERGKLIPSGVARKSVISAAGGDKFEQLMWTLSTVALQQAALRHPAHATAHNLVPNPPQQADTQNRRYAALLRSRIASERAAFARTTQMGRDASLRWAGEIKQLRDRVATIEDRTILVRAELEKMGYDERGVDLRTRETEQLAAERKATVERGNVLSTPDTASFTKTHVIKMSPIDSDESGSVDGAEPDKDDVEDLNRLLTFSANSPGIAKDAEDVVNNFEKSKGASLGTDMSSSFQPRANDPFASDPSDCADVAGLLLAAVEELKKATERMNLISNRGAYVTSDISREASLENDLNQESATSKHTSAGTLVDDVEKSVSIHQALVNSTNSLAGAAAVAARDAAEETELLENKESLSSFLGVKDSQELTGNLLALSRVSSEKTSPQWITDVEAIDVNCDFDDSELFENNIAGEGTDGISDEAEPMSLEMAHPSADRFASAQSLNSKMDFLATVKDLQKAQEVVQTARQDPSKTRSTKTRQSALRKTGNFIQRRPSEEDIPFHQVPMSKVPKRKKNSKSVRFADLPPSYSASKIRKVSVAPLLEPPPDGALDIKDEFDELSEPGAAISALLAQSRESQHSSAVADVRDSRESSVKRKSSLTRQDSLSAKNGNTLSSDLQDPDLRGFRHKPMQRKPTPRHLATRRASAIRQASSDRSESSSSGKGSHKNAATQDSRPNVPSTVIIPLNDISRNKSSQPEPSGPSLNMSTDSQGPDASSGPQSPKLMNGQATSNLETSIEMRTPQAETGKSPSTPRTPATAESAASEPPLHGYLDVELEDDNSSDKIDQVVPRRSMSTPGMSLRRANSQHAQASGGSSRLISFPSLYGRKKKQEREKMDNRGSMSGDEDGFLSWLGGERKSTAGAGGSFHHASRSQSGRAFRTTSGMFTSGRRSSLFSRKKSNAGASSSSRRKKKEEEQPTSPRPNRVKALRDRIAALL